MHTTSDHGVSPLPEVARARGKEAVRLPPTLLTEEANRALQQVYAPDGAASHTVTAVSLPSQLKGDEVVQAVARRGFVIGGGYGKLKASTFRIGHMGDHTMEGLERVLEATAEAVEELLRAR